MLLILGICGGGGDVYACTLVPSSGFMGRGLGSMVQFSSIALGPYSEVGYESQIQTSQIWVVFFFNYVHTCASACVYMRADSQ